MCTLCLDAFVYAYACTDYGSYNHRHPDHAEVDIEWCVHHYECCAGPGIKELCTFAIVTGFFRYTPFSIIMHLSRSHGHLERVNIFAKLFRATE